MITPEVICRNCPRGSQQGGQFICRKSGLPVLHHVTANACPLGKFGEPSPAASAAQEQSRAVVGLLDQTKAAPCLPCAKKAAVCSNCGGQHETAKCPIPAEYDGNYQNDTGGDPGCNCA